MDKSLPITTSNYIGSQALNDRAQRNQEGKLRRKKKGTEGEKRSHLSPPPATSEGQESPSLCGKEENNKTKEAPRELISVLKSAQLRIFGSTNSSRARPDACAAANFTFFFLEPAIFRQADF
jgi:hypothetical protein